MNNYALTAWRPLRLTTLMWVCLIFFIGCGEEKDKDIKTVTMDFRKEGELSIFRENTDSLLTSLDIEIAESEFETQTGLMYRDAMEDEQGMLFIFPTEGMHSFYMKNTRIPLDILFIDGDFSVASIRANAQPMDESSLSSRVPVRYVLEVNAGLVGRMGIQVGDSVAFSKVQAN